MTEPISTATSALKLAGTVAKWQPWAMVKRTDRLVREEYEDVLSWARDDRKKEDLALRLIADDLTARGLLRSGDYRFQLEHARDGYAVRWRDRKRQSERLIATLREAEGMSGQLFRRIFRKRWPENPATVELLDLTRLWEDEELRREAVEQAVDRVSSTAEETPPTDDLKLTVIADGMRGWHGVGSYHVLLYDLLITNASEDRVSLMASMHVMVRPGAWGASEYMPVQAETKPCEDDPNLPQWLECPLEIEPKRSVKGYLWFTIVSGDLINVKGDPKEVFDVTGRSNRLVLRDMVRGQAIHVDVPNLSYLHMDA